MKSYQDKKPSAKPCGNQPRQPSSDPNDDQMDIESPDSRSGSRRMKGKLKDIQCKILAVLLQKSLDPEVHYQERKFLLDLGANVHCGRNEDRMINV